MENNRSLSFFNTLNPLLVLIQPTLIFEGDNDTQQRHCAAKIASCKHEPIGSFDIGDVDVKPKIPLNSKTQMQTQHQDEWCSSDPQYPPQSLIFQLNSPPFLQIPPLLFRYLYIHHRVLLCRARLPDR